MTEKGIPTGWKTSVVVQIKKRVVVSCGSYRAIKLLEHAAKINERILEKRLRDLVKENNYNFDLCREQ